MEYLRKLAAVTETGIYYLVLTLAVLCLSPFLMLADLSEKDARIWLGSACAILACAALAPVCAALWQAGRARLRAFLDSRLRQRQLDEDLAMTEARLELAEAARIKLCRDKADLANTLAQARATLQYQARRLAAARTGRRELEQAEARLTAARNVAARQADEIAALEKELAEARRVNVELQTQFAARDGAQAVADRLADHIDEMSCRLRQAEAGRDSYKRDCECYLKSVAHWLARCREAEREAECLRQRCCLASPAPTSPEPAEAAMSEPKAAAARQIPAGESPDQFRAQAWQQATPVANLAEAGNE